MASFVDTEAPWWSSTDHRGPENGDDSGGSCVAKLLRGLWGGGVAADRLHVRVGAAIHELPAAAGAPLAARGRRVELALEMRHDVLREQLEAALGVVGARPVVTKQQKRAEPAALVDE